MKVSFKFLVLILLIFCSQNLRASVKKLRPIQTLIAEPVAIENVSFSQQQAASPDDDIALFMTTHDSAQAIETGNRIFASLSKKYSLSPGFINLKSRLASTSFLADKMQSQLKNSMSKRLLEITDDKHNKKKSSLAVAPAKSFYDLSIELFSKPINIEELQDNEKTFLIQYYNLILRKHIENISRAGLGYAVAESSFTGTYDYVLVLPLLHSPDNEAVNLNMLPLSMKTPQLLNQLADSALLHFGRVTAAMSLARNAAAVNGTAFNEIDYYIYAARNCPREKANIAVDCLNQAIKLASALEPDRIMELNMQIIEIWQKSNNYTLAAGHAKKTYENFPDHPKAAETIWLYYNLLSLAGRTDTILAEIDNYIDDPVFLNYRANLMYVKWRAMRLAGNNSAQLQVLEYQLLKDYPHNNIVTAVLLSQATDMIAQGNYDQAYVLLNQLIDDFPDAKSSAQAKMILDKLKLKKG